MLVVSATKMRLGFFVVILLLLLVRIGAETRQERLAKIAAEYGCDVEPSCKCLPDHEVCPYPIIQCTGSGGIVKSSDCKTICTREQQWQQQLEKSVADARFEAVVGTSLCALVLEGAYLLYQHHSKPD